jgi:hypothetical protein
MNDEQRTEIRRKFWDDDYFDGLPNKGELLKHFINEFGKAIEEGNVPTPAEENQ